MSLVFQNIESPPPLTARVRGEDTLAGWRRGWGVNILEDARHSSVLYICKYFVRGGVTKRCRRLSWLTISTLVYEHKGGGREGN
jgi:hypothetical protein